jgi:tetratricopeptide (TPR) repeat protein
VSESERWRGSHHAFAMQPALADTVLGNFDGATFDYHGVVTKFTKHDGKFFARTDGADGALHDFEIAYTFGVAPLQQYLIAFQGGRIQALDVCWDARPKELGGQRWFHLYPKENVAHDDILHWTGPYQNWNHMCAECHSTHVHKNYDATKDSFATSWSEIDVACEACHGPASDHVAWAKAHPRGANGASTITSDDRAAHLGLVASLREPEPGSWVMDTTTGIAKRSKPRTSDVEIEACARCHARRSQLTEAWQPGYPLADTHRPSWLEASLYEDDGQIKDEDYEYGSFLQSKMHAAGVTCTDCHDPHALALPPDNRVCAKCHATDRFDTPSHHHHAAKDASTANDPGAASAASTASAPSAAKANGPRCIDCHMPTRDYMVVHTRHDHGFRVPRPDLTVKIGTPNACASCHADHPATWAADAAAKWWGTKRAHEASWAEALHLGNRDLPGATSALTQLAADAKTPGIVRASAIALLADHLTRSSAPVVANAILDPDPIVRLAAATALSHVENELRAQILPLLLRDPVLSVRIEVARALATTPIQPQDRDAQDRALAEWRAVQELGADRAESHLNLGQLEAERGNLDAAEREFRIALKLSPRFPATYLRLAEIFRQRQRDDEAQHILEDGLKIAPNDATLLSALGLALVREQRAQQALAMLAKAASAAPDDPHHAFVYALALVSTDQSERALAVLAQAHEKHPGDRDVLQALASTSRDAGHRTAAIEYAKELVALDPDDPNAQQLLEEMRASDK